MCQSRAGLTDLGLQNLDFVDWDRWDLQVGHSVSTKEIRGDDNVCLRTRLRFEQRALALRMPTSDIAR